MIYGYSEFLLCHLNNVKTKIVTITAGHISVCGFDKLLLFIYVDRAGGGCEHFTASRLYLDKNSCIFLFSYYIYLAKARVIVSPDYPIPVKKQVYAGKRFRAVAKASHIFLRNDGRCISHGP